MSIEDLESDMSRNADDLEAVNFTSLDDVKKYLQQTMYPLMANMVEELGEIDNELAEYVEGRADMLQPATAGIFAAVIVHCLQLCTSVTKLRPNDQKVLAKITQIRNVCQLAKQTLEEITVAPEADAEPEQEPDVGGDAPMPPSSPAGAEEVLDGNA